MPCRCPAGPSLVLPSRHAHLRLAASAFQPSHPHLCTCRVSYRAGHFEGSVCGALVEVSHCSTAGCMLLWIAALPPPDSPYRIRGDRTTACVQACGLPERYVPNMLLAALWASQVSLSPLHLYIATIHTLLFSIQCMHPNRHSSSPRRSHHPLTTAADAGQRRALGVLVSGVPAAPRERSAALGGGAGGKGCSGGGGGGYASGSS